MDDVLKQALLTFAKRRIVTVLGSLGATVSDEWVGQTIAVISVLANEGWQFYKAHKAAKVKSETVKIAA